MTILRQLSHMIRLHRAHYGKSPLKICMGTEAFRAWDAACMATATTIGMVDVDSAPRNEFEGIEVIEDRDMPHPDRIYLLTQPVVPTNIDTTTSALFHSP